MGEEREEKDPEKIEELVEAARKDFEKLLEKVRGLRLS
jgi:hypothetical protein